MSGFTIIHLSDLHIGKKVLEGANPRELADLSAERLAYDFKTIAEEYQIPFRTEETLLVITGDITHEAKWEQYEVAILFMRKLESYFSQYLRTSQLVPGHVICIPGNHDIEVPKEEPDDIAMQRKTKYRSFKLFLDEITDHSKCANDFKLDNPFVNVSIPVPFQIKILDLNTTLNINCYSERQPSFTHDHLRNLSILLGEQKGDFRIALMHHQLSDFASEDSNDKVSQRSLRDWLSDNNFKLVLCGHSHVASGMHSTLLDKKDGLWELGTGHSFVLGKTLRRGNHYQIIRIEHPNKNGISLIRRMYTWRTESWDDRKQNTWQKADLDGSGKEPLEVSNLMDTIGMTDFRNFIGIRSSGKWVVIAHCESSKFPSFGVLSPGEKINANLLEISGYIEGNLDRIDEGSEVTWGGYSRKMALFLVDSPHYNPYVRSILETYGTYLAGGAVRFVDVRAEKPVLQRIQIHSEKLTSNKSEDMKLFDEFEDYLLIMRLPAFVPSTEVTKVEVSDIDKDRVMWVVAGIHSKASYAGAMVFTPRNLQLFATSLQEECGGRLPEYFEAVYKAPSKPERIDNFSDLELVHFKTIRLKREIGMANDLPSGVAARFLSRNRWKTVPIDTVHLDPVAACNFDCPRCIEKEVRQKGLFLSMGACANILCDLKEIGCQNLDFYGGEPTLHPNFDKIIQLSSNLGLDMLLVTNGSRLGEERIQEAIVNARNRIHVRVSIDANSEESHRRNHGLPEKAHYYHNIITHVERLIQQGVSVTISFLLYKDSIDEIEGACRFWKEKHASAFILRPITEQFGKSPELAYNPGEKDKIRELINSYKEFVFTPPWFQRWVNENKPLPLREQPKGYDTCYSGYYRVAISPYYVTDSFRIVTIEDIEMTETSNAWISFCTYRRYDSDYGCEYPQNLKMWSEMEREELLTKINPSTQCSEVICCRDEYNRQIYDLI